MKFEGIYTPVVTPHSDDFSIDKDGFAAVIEHLIASGVHGLSSRARRGVLCAVPEERLELMALAKDPIKGRLPLIVGTGAPHRESIIYAEKAGRLALMLSLWPRRLMVCRRQ